MDVDVNYTVRPSRYWIRGDQIAKSNFARSRFVEIFRTASETDDHKAVICTVFSFSMIRIQQQRRETWWSTKSEKHKDESEIFGDFNERILVGIIISMSCTIITV